MRAEEVQGLMEAYSHVYEAPEVLNEEVVEEETEQLDEIAINPAAAGASRNRSQAAAVRQKLQGGGSINVSGPQGFFGGRDKAGTASLNKDATKSQGRTVLNFNQAQTRGGFRGSQTGAYTPNTTVVGGEKLYKAKLGGKDVYVGARKPGSTTPTPAKPGTPAAPAKPGTPGSSSPAKPGTPAAPAKPGNTTAGKPTPPTAPSKPAAKPATGMLGKTSYEVRTPTSAELKAAQAARAGGEKNPEKVLQAAKAAGTTEKTFNQKPGPTTGAAAFKPTNSPIKTPQPAAKLDSGVGFGAAKPTPAPTTPAAPQMSARAQALKAGGPAGSAREKVLNQSADIFDLVKGHLLDEGYADSEEGAMVIMVNMSEEWKKSILEAHGVELDEAQEAREKPEEHEEKEEKENEKKYGHVRGEKTPMPPRGDKRREEFEKWYAKNVR